jgi:hypothetical protein
VGFKHLPDVGIPIKALPMLFQLFGQLKDTI